jgi:hypothetical protein
MIDIIFSLAVVFQASAIGLGVGTSTLAITSFLVAIADGTIEPAERRMLGVIYTTLRVAMLSIVATTGVVTFLRPEFFSSTAIYLFLLIFVLFFNAVLMTKHWISSKFGPAIQAATWYTLGFIVTIHMFKLFEVTSSNFWLLYLADLVLAFVIVNALMWYLKKKRLKSQ